MIAVALFVMTVVLIRVMRVIAVAVVVIGVVTVGVHGQRGRQRCDAAFGNGWAVVDEVTVVEHEGAVHQPAEGSHLVQDDQHRHPLGLELAQQAGESFL